jgi:signal transduction histidine kinase
MEQEPIRSRDSIPQRSRKKPVLISSGHGRFRPRARLIRTIGAELISSETVAIIELVRNSYDADARKVQIRFMNPHLPDQAGMEITDDGHGMTREVLLGPWLEPATDFKETGASGPHGGEWSPGGRRRLGSKGVGRFAAQRLGGHLLVRTSAGSGATLEAEFNWGQLDRADRYLDQLTIPWRELRSLRAGWRGTSLAITSLRDRWTLARFERLRLALARLLGPRLAGDLFSIELIIDGQIEKVRPAIGSLRAMYSVRGEVGTDGRARIRYQDMFGIKEVWTRTVLWPASGQTCGPFTFRISAWDLEREALDFFIKKAAVKIGPRSFRRTIRDHSGISLYRDGFRILPYGEPDNDWLRLDRRRVNNPTLRLSNNQILGSVHISADRNPGLRDQTNREGLVSSDAYTHLQHVLIELLSYFETKRFAARRSSEFASKSPILHIAGARGTAETEAVLQRFSSKDSVASGDLRDLRDALSARDKAGVETLRRYAGLAAAGQIVAAAFTRVLHPLRQVESELSLAKTEVETLEIRSESREDILSALHRAKRRLRGIQHIMECLDPLARPRGVRRLGQLDLEACVSDVAGMLSDEIAQRQIDYQFVPNGSSRVLGDLSIVEQVLAILFDNSLFWLEQVQPPRLLRVRILEDGFVLENNGPSIPAAARELVFEPTFTTREDASGMGLTLARDLLRSVGGKINLESRRRGAAFRVNLPTGR